MRNSRRRIWCETLPYEEVRRRDVLALLRSRGVGLLLAVRPPDLAELGRTLAAAADAEVPVALWPMLDDAAGRWASARSIDAYGVFARRACDAARASGAPLAELAVDLEPCIDDVRDALDGGLAPRRLARALATSVSRYTPARAALAGLVDELAKQSVVTSAAVLPTVLLDDPGAHAHPTWQKLLGTPVTGVGFAHASVMVYTSILEGWSRGALGRDDARALVSSLGAMARDAWGDRAGLSLGCVGIGAFGDEPTYHGPSELADDVGLALAAGVDDLALFDLGGVLRRAPAEAWLDAFVDTEATRSVRTRTTTALVGALRASSAPLRGAAPLVRFLGR